MPVEVGGLDHEGVALPAAARVAGVLADLPRHVGAPVEGDETRVVDVLLQNRHHVGGLHDVVVVVVAGGERRDAAVPEAAVAQVELLVGLDRQLAAAHPREPARLRRVHPGLHLRGQRRQPAVLGVDDDRGPPVGHHRRPPLHPEVVVGPHAAARLGAPGRRVQQVRVPLDRALREAGRLLLGQERPVREVRGALQRGQGGVVPDALQVGVAPRGAGRGRLGRLAHSRGRHQHQREYDGRDGER